MLPMPMRVRFTIKLQIMLFGEGADIQMLPCICQVYQLRREKCICYAFLIALFLVGAKAIQPTPVAFFPLSHGDKWIC